MVEEDTEEIESGERYQLPLYYFPLYFFSTDKLKINTNFLHGEI